MARFVHVRIEQRAGIFEDDLRDVDIRKQKPMAPLVPRQAVCQHLDEQFQVLFNLRMLLGAKLVLQLRQHAAGVVSAPFIDVRPQIQYRFVVSVQAVAARRFGVVLMERWFQAGGRRRGHLRSSAAALGGRLC